MGRHVNPQLYKNRLNNSFQEIPLSDHGVARDRISKNALKVTDRLQQAGFRAYVVGGAPRDLLLGFAPKDFDVGTDATPEQVRALFRNARLIGRRFRLAHVRFGREIIEVATFRGTGDAGERSVEDNGRVLRDNVFGSEAEDAIRRDFTINALMYDPSNGTIRDYTDGYADVAARTLRLIGDPDQRYREDPVRMLRAIRFKSKLDLKIDAPSEDPIPGMAPLLADIPPARLLDELLKLLLGGRAWEGFRALVAYGLWQELFPGLLESPENPPTLIEQAFRNTDQRVAQGKPVTPGFLFAALFWPRVREEARRREDNGQPPVEALATAGEKAFSKFTGRVSIHRRFSTMAKEIWMFQPRFGKRRGKRAMRLLQERRFRAAYDFLLLRAEEGEAVAELAEWWTEVQRVDAETRNQMIFGASKKKQQPKIRPNS
ncbi:MAG: polynucleotide adenylyltransferase PcnB [Wenzhouxiangellaceae bacterium]|nr:polynucleotide adenylyltransferase PcnB [Wenzhouxiangellaceae bacterium]